ETLKMQVEHRGVIYAPRSNMAITGVVTNQPRSWFYAPGTTNAIIAGGDWLPQLQASQWRLFKPGDEHFAVSEDDDAIYRVHLDSLDHIAATQFAPRGGTSVVADSAGNVYVASGQLYIYNSAGRQIGVVEIPERPGSVAFGGPDRKTLFIGARNALFSIRTASAEANSARRNP
ncbi:MAG: SMP-30/gluconolactonase/LRE family protein, partial [Terracidiphilus sp.]